MRGQDTFSETYGKNILMVTMATLMPLDRGILDIQMKVDFCSVLSVWVRHLYDKFG